MRKLSDKETWPSLEVGLDLFPWRWRLWAWTDDENPCKYAHAQVGPLQVTWACNWPLFTEPEVSDAQTDQDSG